jgi:hypothetical protein
VTVLRLAGLRSPADFADWFRLGAEYVRDVTEGMGFRVEESPAREGSAAAAGDGGRPDAASTPAHGAGDLTGLIAAGAGAMRAGRTDVDPAVARFVAADLLADAAFPDPFCEWTPLWYELSLAAPNALAARRLRAVARAYVGDGDGNAAGVAPVAVPRFSRPRDCLVGGRSPIAGLGAGPTGFARRFVLADAVLHVEWYAHVAREAGVRVPGDLLARTRRESLSYWTGRRDRLSPDVRRFQALLFADDAWVRGIDEAYDLDSALLSVWERLCRREREALLADRRSPLWSES